MNSIINYAWEREKESTYAIKEFLEGPWLNKVSQLWKDVNSNVEENLPKKFSWVAKATSPILFVLTLGISYKCAESLWQKKGILGVVAKVAAYTLIFFNGALVFAASAYYFGVGPAAYAISSVFTAGIFVNLTMR